MHLLVHGRRRVMARTTTKLPKKPKTASKSRDDIARKHYAWIDWLSARTGLSDTKLAEAAGFEANNYIYRNRGEGNPLNITKIERLCEHFNVPGPDTYLAADISSAEIESFDEAKCQDLLLRKMVQVALKDRPNAQAWVLHTHALEDIGYQIGDVIITDTAATAKAGDAVIGSITEAGAVEYVARINQPPYLVAGSRDELFRSPFLIDRMRVNVVAPITQSFRSRRN